MDNVIAHKDSRLFFSLSDKIWNVLAQPLLSVVASEAIDESSLGIGLKSVLSLWAQMDSG